MSSQLCCNFKKAYFHAIYLVIEIIQVFKIFRSTIRRNRMLLIRLLFFNNNFKLDERYLPELCYTLKFSQHLAIYVDRRGEIQDGGRRK